MPKGQPKNGINAGWFKKGHKFGGRNHVRKGHPTYSDPERIRKLSEAKRGENHHNWKGGISSINSRIRQSKEYKLWRKSVFERDNFYCVFCGYKSRGKRPADIHADHIKPFAYYPELRFAIDNGRTLCIPCHKKTENYKAKKIKKCKKI